MVLTGMRPLSLMAKQEAITFGGAAQNLHLDPELFHQRRRTATAKSGEWTSIDNEEFIAFMGVTFHARGGGVN